MKSPLLAYLHGAHCGGDPEKGEEPDLPAAKLPNLFENIIVVEHVASESGVVIGSSSGFFRASHFSRSARPSPSAGVILTVFLASGHVVVKLSSQLQLVI